MQIRFMWVLFEMRLSFNDHLSISKGKIVSGEFGDSIVPIPAHLNVVTCKWSSENTIFPSYKFNNRHYVQQF